MERGFPILHISNLKKFLLVCLLALFISSQAGRVSAGLNVWTSIGPEGGVIRALAIDPKTPSTLYAGIWGSVFKSTNGGGSWSAVNTGLPAHPNISTLATGSMTPTWVYTVTYGDGVFISEQPAYWIYQPLLLRSP